MTLKKHPEVLALFAIVAICAFGSRSADRPQFRLSTLSDRLDQRSARLGERTECAVDRLQTKIDEVIARVHQRVEQKRVRIAYGL